MASIDLTPLTCYNWIFCVNRRRGYAENLYKQTKSYHDVLNESQGLYTYMIHRVTRSQLKKKDILQVQVSKGLI